MRIFQVDAFTRTRFTGNPATVILDADGLDDPTLAAIAREFSHAEVAFVLAGADAQYDVRLRFFNARKEAPFVGHATLAAHAVLLALGRRPLGVSRQLSGTGVIEVRASAAPSSDSGSAHGNAASSALIEFRQTPPEFEAPLSFETARRVADALSLPSAELHPILPTRLARKGSTRLLIPVSNCRSLGGLMPHTDTLLALGKELGTDGFFVFAVERAGEAIVTESRMFCPALGIPEDPVSGNAHAMLAAYLWQLGQFARGATGFVGRQGRHMHRPGEVNVNLEFSAGSLLAAHIGGRAVIVSDGMMSL